MPTSRRSNRLAALVAVPLLLALLVWSISWGVASLFHDQAERLVPTGAEAPAPTRLAAALVAVARARQLDPLSPAYRHTEARLLEAQAVDPALTPAQAAARLSQAEAAYLSALARRPTWPYSAAALARVRLKRGQIGPPLEQALVLAVRLGRWEPGLQRSLLGMGFAAWPLLSGTERARLVPLIKAGLVLQPDAIMALAMDLDRWSVLAPLVAGDPALEARARRYDPAAGR